MEPLRIAGLCLAALSCAAQPVVKTPAGEVSPAPAPVDQPELTPAPVVQREPTPAPVVQPEPAPPETHAPSLRLWYRFEETEGQIIDSAGAHNGNPVHAERGVPGRVGRALRVSGRTEPSHVVVEDPPDVSQWEGATISAWIHLREGQCCRIMSRGDERPGAFPFEVGMLRRNLSVSVGNRAAWRHTTPPAATY